MANVVITGGTRGLGRALTKRFLEMGDKVAICSRSQESIDQTLEELDRHGSLIGKVCDIKDFENVREFAEWCSKEFNGQIDYWINNAGIANPTKAFLSDLPPEEVEEVIRTNLIGTILATKAALQVMEKQKSGHIFLMEGMGSNGRPTPRILPYGASKAPFPQLLKTLLEETKGSNIGIHTLSPGIVLTDLLLENTPNDAKRIFNILAEKPEIPAAFLVEKIRGINGTGKRIRYLSRWKIMKRFLIARRYRNRFFDDQGNLLVDL